MELRCVFRTSWTCLLLFGSGAGFLVRRDPAVLTFSFKSRFGDPNDGFGSGPAADLLDSMDGDLGGGFGSGPAADLLSSEDDGIAQMFAHLLRLSPRGPSSRFPWTLDHVPLGSVEGRLMYPSSHIVHSSSGYQRARDFRSDSKYTQDSLDHVPLPGSHPERGSGGPKQ